MNSLIEINNLSLFILTLLMIFNGLFSYLLSLGLTKSLFISALRTFVQLLFIGYVLNFIFMSSNHFYMLAVVFFMTFLAGYTSSTRIRAKHKLQFLFNFLSFLMGVWPPIVLGLFLISDRSLLSPQYVIPIVGMLLGNSLNAISLGIDTFQRELKERWVLIVSDLSLGASLDQALATSMRAAMYTSLTPLLNTMAVAGLVSLPGMMTGQILAGASPWEASKYQILIMFLICTSCLWGTFISIKLSSKYLFRKSEILFLDWARS